MAEDAHWQILIASQKLLELDMALSERSKQSFVRGRDGQRQKRFTLEIRHHRSPTGEFIMEETAARLLATAETVNEWFKVGLVHEVPRQLRSRQPPSALIMTETSLFVLRMIRDVVDEVKRVLERTGSRDPQDAQGYLAADLEILNASIYPDSRTYIFTMWDNAMGRFKAYQPPRESDRKEPDRERARGLTVGLKWGIEEMHQKPIGIVMNMLDSSGNPLFVRVQGALKAKHSNLVDLLGSCDGRDITFIHELIHFVSRDGHGPPDPIADVGSKPYDWKSITTEALDIQLTNAENYMALIFNLWLNGDRYTWPCHSSSRRQLDQNDFEFPSVELPRATLQELAKYRFEVVAITRCRAVEDSEGQPIKRYEVRWKGDPYLTWLDESVVLADSRLRAALESFQVDSLKISGLSVSDPHSSGSSKPSSQRITRSRTLSQRTTRPSKA